MKEHSGNKTSADSILVTDEKIKLEE